jgi:osomolarity two-component system sensor histidine kinase SLN1
VKSFACVVEVHLLIANSLWGDQHRILQVVINLVSNSLKFTPAGGKVSVRIKCLGEAELPSDRNSLGSKKSKNSSRHRHNSGSSNISGMPSNSSAAKPNSSGGTVLQINPMDPRAAPRVQVRERSPTPPPSNARTLIFQFEVEDSGPGIPESMQDKVFEPFVQGDLGLSKKYGGTGLGLSICSQLSQLMGGKISLTSTQIAPTGTTFKVQIPLKHTKSRAPSTSSSDAYGQSRPTSGVYSGHADGTITAVPASPSNRNSGEFNKETRLVGLSQPFFAAASPTSPEEKEKELGMVQSVLKKAAAATDKEPAKKLRVLVAEDNLVNQEIVIRMLKLERIYDVEVVVAEDGKEAYDIVKESMDKGQYFNLIFMDIQVCSTHSEAMIETNVCRCPTLTDCKARVLFGKWVTRHLSLH